MGEWYRNRKPRNEAVTRINYRALTNTLQEPVRGKKLVQREIKKQSRETLQKWSKRKEEI